MRSVPQVGIYCRLSIEDRDKMKCDDSQSIHNQKSMLCDYCKERGWDIYDIYCDDGYSGVDRNRPEFIRMLGDCQKSKIDIVLCKDQSRFSRDIVVIEEYINDKFLEWGIRFVGVADNSDSDSESYSTMRLFTSAYNEMYVKDISSKIRKTLSYKREQGQFIGSFAPYGYKIDPNDKHHLVIDEDTADVVKMIFDMFVSGNGYRKIVQKLNEKGILSPSAYKQKTGSNYVNCNANSSSSKRLWTQSTVAAVLRNEMYTGTLVQGKSRNVSYKNKKKKKVSPDKWIKISNTHEAIIDSQTWESAQQRIKSRVRSSGTDMTLSPLSGKVKCAVCGKPMKRNVYYNKSKTIKYYSLQCASYKIGAMNCPNTKSISGRILEKKIIDELNILIQEYCQKDKLHITDVYTEQAKKTEKQLTSLTAQQEIIKNRLTQMYKDKLDGIISADDFKIFRESITREETDIGNSITETKQKLDECYLRVQKSDNQQLIEKYIHFDELNRTVVDEFIDCIEIGQPSENGDREIHIYWKI